MKKGFKFNPLTAMFDLVNKFSLAADGNPPRTNPVTLLSGTNVTLVDNGDDTITINASGSTPVLTGYIEQEEYTATAGQVNFPLVATPLDAANVAVNVRGQWLLPADFVYNVGDNSVDILGGVVLNSDVSIYFSTGQNGVTFLYELSAGSGANWPLTSTPVDASGIWVIVDGGIVPKSEYAYDSVNNEVVFHPGNEIAPGQQVVIFYQDGGTVLQSAQESLLGVVDGSNDTFGPLRFDPNEVESVVLLRDGRRVPYSQYMMSGKSFVFNATFEPQIGQNIEAIYYFVDVESEQTQYISVTQEQLDAKQLQLDFTPKNPTEVMFDLNGIGFAVYGVDFIVEGNTVKWNGLGLDGFLSLGTRLRFHYHI